MEERQFLHRLCTTALHVDASIEFAGIIDSNGKLLVGKSRNIRHNPNFSKRKITCSSLRNFQSIMVTHFLKIKPCHQII